jgi:phenylacetate-coenzyme A ligase PaaK-like adenylate-forming protein
MRKTLATLVLARRMRQLRHLTHTYAAMQDSERIAEIQLTRFNAHWGKAWKNVPFYRRWRELHRLPERIDRLHDLHEFPVLTKSAISDERELIANSPGNERSTLTGGTSGISTAFPMGRQDADAAWINTHVGREWNGIEPNDRLFMIWGHSHLFGGRGAVWKQLKRKVKDSLNNIYRVSAYSLDDAQLDEIASRIIRLRPKYVIGYGSCLMRLCNYLDVRRRGLRDAKVTRVVNTSETLDAGDALLVSSVFGCPVINEYGMAEAGVIGYSCGELYPIRVLWSDYLVQTSSRRLMLTTLGQRCFPLINYDTEDLCGDLTPDTGALLSLSNLLGKARDVFEIMDMRGSAHEVSVVLFDHILKQIGELRSLHYDLDPDGTVQISYTTDGSEVKRSILLSRFASGLRQEGIDIDPARVKFVHLTQLLQTAAGKRRTLTRPSSLTAI